MIETGKMNINVTAFGFKYGMPSKADYIFDVRCLPNPFYVPELKAKTGNDPDVRDYVMNSPESKEFMDRLVGMTEFVLPLYIKKERETLTIAIGCTGGKHRSVTVAKLLAEELSDKGYNVNCILRDVGKE